jgi:NADPH-dependent F420 reductase
MLGPAMSGPVAIVGGTGDEGFGLALRWASAGIPVVIGSRAQEKGQAAAAEANTLLEGRGGATVEGTSNAEAVAACDVVVVTVPFAAQSDIYRSIAGSIRSGAVVCDATSPLATAVGGRPWQVVRPWAGSAAEQAKALLADGTRLVSGFHTVSAEALRDLDGELEGDVLLCGADAEAKASIGDLVDLIPKLRWVDAGVLSVARLIEPLTALMVSVNRSYGIHETGVALTGRVGWGRPPERKPKA